MWSRLLWHPHFWKTHHSSSYWRNMEVRQKHLICNWVRIWEFVTSFATNPVTAWIQSSDFTMEWEKCNMSLTSLTISSDMSGEQSPPVYRWKVVWLWFNYMNKLLSVIHHNCNGQFMLVLMLHVKNTWNVITLQFFCTVNSKKHERLILCQILILGIPYCARIKVLGLL